MPNNIYTLLQGGNNYSNQFQAVGVDPGIIGFGNGNGTVTPVTNPVITGNPTGVLQPVTGSGNTTLPVNTSNPATNTTNTGSATNTTTTTTNTGGTGTTTTNTNGMPDIATDKPFYKLWWVWVIVAVVVVGGGYFIFKNAK